VEVGFYLCVLNYTLILGIGLSHLHLCSAGLSKSVNCFCFAGLGVGGENSWEYEGPGNTANLMFYHLYFDIPCQTKYDNKLCISCFIENAYYFFIVLLVKESNMIVLFAVKVIRLCQQKN
jgi:hypothetical protein